MTDRIDDILGLLGLGPTTAPPPLPPLTTTDEDGFALVEANGATWIELEGDWDGVFRIARPKARRLIAMIAEVRAWAEGGRPSGRRGDCQWEPTRRRGQDLLEIRIAHWKPMRIARPTAIALLRNEERIRDFAR